ncbi:MAG: hypothetical protein Q9165_001963 [Trypethelium subeluteriae]
MADPLSIAASALAVGGAATKTCEAIRILWSLRHADRDLSDLTNELAAFNDTLKSIELTLQIIAQSHRDATVVSGLLRRLEDVCEQAVKPLSKLQRLNETKLRRYRDGQPLQASKWAWIRQKKAVNELRNRLRISKESLVPLLLALITYSSVLQMNHIDTDGPATRDTEQLTVVTKSEDHGWPTNSTAISIHLGDKYREGIEERSSFTRGEDANMFFRKSSPGWHEGHGFLKTLSYFTPYWASMRAISLHVLGMSLSGPFATMRSLRMIPRDATVWPLIQCGATGKLQLLFDSGEFSPFDTLDDGTSLLHYAGSSGRADVCSFLLQNGADKYFRNDHGIAAIQPGLDLFLKNGLSGLADLDLFLEEAFSDHQGFSFLHRIILGYCPLDLNEQLRHNTLGDLNVVDSNRRTPLLWAAWNGRVEYVQLLVDYGAAVDHMDIERETPLNKACKAGQIECANVLLEGGASPHIGNCYHIQPIHYASLQKHDAAVGILEALLKHGADVNARTDSLATPLHFAASSGIAKNVDYLIQRDADLQARNRSHLDASLLALANWHNDLFCYLVRLGADIQPSPGSVVNVLHLAAWGGSEDSWIIIEEAVRDSRLCAMNHDVWHNDHTVWECLEKCRPFRSCDECQAEKTDFAKIRKIQDSLQIMLNRSNSK